MPTGGAGFGELILVVLRLAQLLLPPLLLLLTATTIVHEQLYCSNCWKLH